tara:strand:- start:74 stop:361 length:288 start_codon:yes stop_codon:yes gene_type:complete
MTDISKAIKALRPNSSFGVIGDRIKWNDPDNKQPTETEINDKIVELKAQYDALRYQRDRQYPPIGEQLDEIYHKGIDEWKKTIKKVKDNHPKPTE